MIDHLGIARIAALALLAWAPSMVAAQALDPCATDLRSRPIGPLQVGTLDGNLGVPHRACPRQEFTFGGEGLVVADTADFYGNIRVNARGRFSGFLFDENVEAFVSWEAFRYQTLISAVSSDYIGVGYLSWGASGQLVNQDGRVYAFTGRIVAPTGFDQNSTPWAMDLGLTGAWQLDANFRVHIWVNLLGSVIAGGGPAAPRAGLRFGGGLDWRPVEWLAFVAELQSGFFYVETLDFVAANAGVRLGLGDEVGLELAVALPFLGVRAFDDGALPLAASLMVNWHMP